MNLKLFCNFCWKESKVLFFILFTSYPAFGDALRACHDRSNKTGREILWQRSPFLCCVSSPHYLARFDFSRLELHLSACHLLQRWHFPCLMPQKRRGLGRKFREEMKRVGGVYVKRRYAREGLNSRMVRKEKRGG